MHILLIHQAFAALNEPGGTRHHEFARLLVQHGHRVTIIASPISYLTGAKGNAQKFETDMDGKITIYRTFTYAALHKSFIHRLISFFSFMVSSFFKAMQIKDIDVVWGTSPPIFQAVTAWLVARIKGAKYLLEIRDLWPAFAVAVGVLKNKIIISLSEWLEKFLLQRADHVVVNSPGYIDHVKKRGARRVTLVPNGSDRSFFKDDPGDSLRDELGWKEKFVILYAGAHGLSNDLTTVLSAAKILSGEKDIIFALLGDGKEKPALLAQAKRLNLSNVHFLDPVSKKDMSAYLHASDVCLAILKGVELYKTTYPNKVFDYMAAGKPILLAIDGVIREVVENAACGYFCEPENPTDIANCVLKMSKMGSRQLQTMGNLGRDYLNLNFDRKMSVNIFSNTMEEMVKTNV